MVPLKLFMKTRKLVSGILSIVLSVFVLFQSALAGVANTMSANGEAGGSAGLFGLAALFGFTGVRSYGDLYIRSLWCLINAVLAVVALVKMKKSLKMA